MTALRRVWCFVGLHAWGKWSASRKTAYVTIYRLGGVQVGESPEHIVRIQDRMCEYCGINQERTVR